VKNRFFKKFVKYKDIAAGLIDTLKMCYTSIGKDRSVERYVFT